MSEIIRTIVIALGLAGGSVILAFSTRWIMRALFGKMSRRTASVLDDLVLKGLETPVMLIVVVVGFYAAAWYLLRSNPWEYDARTLAPYIKKTHQAFRAATILAVALGLIRTLNIIARWYSSNITPRTTATQVEVLKKLTNIVVWAVVVVMVLAQFGYNISALVATLGIGGLAVALALQDTLSNVFAGFYLMADKSVRVGDYVKLDSGEEGFVEEVSWRNTRIRLWANNMVIIPNAKLVQSVMTNYDLPQHQMSVYVNCGVGYNSDLEHVERVCIDVARKILAEVPGGVQDFEPVVRFKEFGDSNINFLVILRAVDVSAQYLIHHEYMKAIHRRFREEGIEISWPVRVIVPAGDGKTLA